MMWRTALLLGTKVLVGHQVQANSGDALQDIINSPDLDRTLKYVKYLDPESKLGSSLQTAVQKLHDLEDAPTCNKMASFALLQTCATFTDQDKKSTQQVVEQEKKLFAARHAVCELMDSNEVEIIPEQCTVFIVAEGNPGKSGYSEQLLVDGRQKPFSGYRDYSVATGKDLEPCVAALSKNPQTWSSYSNSKQLAETWCPAVRGDIETEELLRKLKEGFEIVGLTHEALREQAEAIQQQKEAVQFINAELRNFVQHISIAYEMSGQIFDGFEGKLQGTVEKFEEHINSQLGRTNSAFEAMTQEAFSKLNDMLSRAHDAAEEKTTAIALAQTKNAEDSRQQMEYAQQLFEQRMLQISYNATNTIQEYNMQVVGTLQEANYQVLALKEQLSSNQEIAQNVTVQLQQHQAQADNITQTLGEIQLLANEVVLVLGYLWAFVESICDAFEPVIGYFRYIVGIVVLLLLGYFLGGSRLLQVAGSIIKHTSTAAGVIVSISSKLAKRASAATVSYLSEAGHLLKQSMGAKCAVFILLAVVGVTRYLLVVESPNQLIQRWERLDVTQVELTILVMAIAFVSVVLSAPFIMRLMHLLYAKADDEEQASATPSAATRGRGLPFNNPKNFAVKKWSV